MGEILVGESWLLNLANQGKKQREVAARLLRMQILTANRSGHVLFLGWTPYRDQIVKASHFGKLAGLIVECAECHCQALLWSWEQAAKMTAAERKRKWQELRPMVPRAARMYLAKCIGSELSGLAAASPELPATGGDS